MAIVIAIIIVVLGVLYVGLCYWAVGMSDNPEQRMVGSPGTVLTLCIILALVVGATHWIHVSW